MANRNRIPTVFSIYMLDVICCALGCVILLWQWQHYEAEQQAEAARLQAEATRKAEEEGKLNQDRWKLASHEVDSLTSEIAGLRDALLAMQKKHATLSIDMARTAQERDEANRVIAVRQKEYETLRQAWLLSEALLKGVRGDLVKLKDAQKQTALELAGKVKANAELLLQIAAAEKKAKDYEKQ